MALGEFLGEPVPPGKACGLCKFGRNECAHDVSCEQGLCPHPFRDFATASTQRRTNLLIGAATIVHELRRHVVG